MHKWLSNTISLEDALDAISRCFVVYHNLTTSVGTEDVVEDCFE